MTNNSIIVNAIEDSFVDYLNVVAVNGNKPFVLNDTLGWVKTDPTAWSNFLFYANFTHSEIDDQISMVCSKIKQGELPMDWVVGPKSYPRDLGDYLEKHNIKKMYSMAGMAIDISSLDRNVPLPENVHIETITTLSGLRLWAEIVSKGLWNGDPFEACLFEKLLGNPNYKFYLALYNGEAVASSMLMLTSGVAEINMVSTILEYRGKGIGTAMTTRPLLDARDQGYELGVLQASNPGEPVYRRIGFKEYCRFDVYRYQPM